MDRYLDEWPVSGSKGASTSLKEMSHLRAALARGYEIQPAAEAQQEFADELKTLVRTLWRRRGAFFLGCLPAILVAIAYLHFATALFTASATIVLDPRKQVVTTSPEVLPDLAPDSSVVDTQVQLIKSAAVLGRAVDELHLVAQPSADRPSGFVAQAVKRWQDWFGPSVAEAPTPPSREAIIDRLRSNLDVSRIGLTHAISIGYTSVEPARAAQFANAVASAYLAYQGDMKQRATRDANQWLNDRVGEVRQRMEEAETAVDRYRSSAGLLTARGTTSTESQVTGLDIGLNEAQQRLTEAHARFDSYWNALSDGGVEEAARIVSTPAMQHLRAQLTDLLNQQAQLSSSLGATHPQMLELRRQIDALKSEMNVEAQRTVEEFRDDVAVAEKRVEGLLAVRNRSRTQLAQDNAANVELMQLQANAQTLRTIYEDMLTRLQQTMSQTSLNQVNATIVSAARIPSAPSSPRKDLVLSIAAAIGLACGAIAVMFSQVRDGTFASTQDVERRTHLPILAVVPWLRHRDLRLRGRRILPFTFVLAKPLSLFAESFRTLRVAVQHSIGSGHAMVVQVTSGTFAEGKTVSSIAFAQAAAVDGRRVLLIDADVRRRSLTQYLGITVSMGLMEVLRGSATLDQVLLKSDEPGEPAVLPLSTSSVGPHDRFSGQTFGNLLQHLKRTFDLIVIDSAPVLAVAESLVIAQRVDAVVVVARWSKTPAQTVMNALESIRRAGGRIAGLVLTQVDMKRMTNQAHGKGHYSALMRYYQQ